MTGQQTSVERLVKACRRRWAALLPLALVLPGVFAAVASAQEFCEGGCTWGVNCPTQPNHRPGGVELPLCIDPVGPSEPGRQEASSPSAIVEEEHGEATGTSTGTLSGKIDPQGERIESIEWQYDSVIDIFGGEVSLPSNHSEVSGGSEIQGGATEPISSSVALSSLEPDTAYSFRVVVRSLDGTVTDGPIESFRTPPITGSVNPSTSSSGSANENNKTSPGSSMMQTPEPSGQPSAPSTQSTDLITTTPTPFVGVEVQHPAHAVYPPKRTRMLRKPLKACLVRPASRRAACVRRAERRHSPRRQR